MAQHALAICRAELSQIIRRAGVQLDVRWRAVGHGR